MLENELPNWSVEDIVHNLGLARIALEQLDLLTGMTKADILKMEARLSELTNPNQTQNVQ